MGYKLASSTNWNIAQSPNLGMYRDRLSQTTRQELT